MFEAFLIVVAAAAGFLVAWQVRRPSQADSQQLRELQSGLASSQGTLTETQRQLQQRDAALAESAKAMLREQELRVAAETRAAEVERSVQEQRRLLTEDEKRLREAFEALSARALRENNEQFARQASEQVKPLSEAIERYRGELREIEQQRQSAYGKLTQQLQDLAGAHQHLSRSTAELSTALRSPQVKGRWGEITLRRAVEAAGLNPHCDFVEQLTVANGEGSQRPDLVVRLPGGRTIVVDAKAPTSAYLDAVEARDAATREAALAGHARAIRAHMQTLSGRSYWKQFQATPEFVVMFVPGEAFFAAALEQDRELIEQGVRSKVILASPTTLIALLQGVAYGWQQQDMLRHAQEIGETARDLFERICRFADHFARIGESLRRATDAYNEAIGSWQRRVLPAGRRIAALGVRVENEKAADLQQVEVTPRELPESYVTTVSPRARQNELGFGAER
jgi:DNA recombination protein RmuC